jgi:hypothetical protein
VLAEAGKSKAVAFDEIDKAPEEKARGITIATAHGTPRDTRLRAARRPDPAPRHARRPRRLTAAPPAARCVQWSTRLTSGTTPTSTAPATPTT